MPKSIHVEGIPGSGKSTASKRLCELLRGNGIDAAWWLEEAADHPIMLKERRALSGESEFPEICLVAWDAFLATLDRVAVLDGYVLQNTVRFLFANLVDRAEIDEYFDKWQQIGSDTSIVFLAVENPSAHYELVLPERGDAWTSKLFSYVERTPYGVAHGLRGKEGFAVFWSDYQDLCRALLEAARVPVEFLSSRSWDNADLEKLAGRRGLM